MSVVIHDDTQRKSIISVPNRVSTKLPPQKTNEEVGNDKTLNPLSQGKKIRIDVEVRNGKTIPHWQRKFTQEELKQIYGKRTERKMKATFEFEDFEFSDED